MKLTKSRLKQLIKEELEDTLDEERYGSPDNFPADIKSISDEILNLIPQIKKRGKASGVRRIDDVIRYLEDAAKSAGYALSASLGKKVRIRPRIDEGEI